MIKKFLNRIKNVFGKKGNKSDTTAYLDLVGICDNSLRWKIWITYYDEDGDATACIVHNTTYAHKCSAVRRAKQLWGDNPMCKWVVSQTCPWGVNTDGAAD